MEESENSKESAMKNAPATFCSSPLVLQTLNGKHLVQAGEVGGDGIPMLTVVVGGCWARDHIEPATISRRSFMSRVHIKYVQYEPWKFCEIENDLIKEKRKMSRPRCRKVFLKGRNKITIRAESQIYRRIFFSKRRLLSTLQLSIEENPLKEDCRTKKESSMEDVEND
ncbi:hypothetical protein NPIL_462871 [Nephila pilipes]|uniref:Uncharacterized protein n=1 Tax=Nephila pilipes TaxID=299642 RepID=A0A8X6Q725_NEPPI|nr:hypothetical protein NPIL_462871 [Nephila pilipes]